MFKGLFLLGLSVPASSAVAREHRAVESGAVAAHGKVERMGSLAWCSVRKGIYLLTFRKQHRPFLPCNRDNTQAGGGRSITPGTSHPSSLSVVTVATAGWMMQAAAC